MANLRSIHPYVPTEWINESMMTDGCIWMLECICGEILMVGTPIDDVQNCGALSKWDIDCMVEWEEIAEWFFDYGGRVFCLQALEVDMLQEMMDDVTGDDCFDDYTEGFYVPH